LLNNQGLSIEQYKNIVGTKRHFVGMFIVLDKQKHIVYSLISENGNKGIPQKAKGYGVATMTVPKQSLEVLVLTLDFEGEKKAPPISRRGLVVL